MLVLTRFLSPGDFGLVAIAASIVAIFEAALELPVYQVLVRVPDLQRSHYDTAFTLGLLRGFALTGMIGVLVIPVSRAYGDPRLAVSRADREGVARLVRARGHGVSKLYLDNIPGGLLPSEVEPRGGCALLRVQRDREGPAA